MHEADDERAAAEFLALVRESSQAPGGSTSHRNGRTNNAKAALGRPPFKAA